MVSTAVRTSLTAVTMITAIPSPRARICGRTVKDSRTPCSSSMTSATGLGREGSESALMASGLVRNLEDDVLAAGPAPLDLHGHGLARIEKSHRLPELFHGADPAAVDLAVV